MSTVGLIKKETGLPDMSEEEKNEGYSKSVKFLLMGPLIFQGIGVGIVTLFHFFGQKSLYEKRIAQLQEYDLQYAYLSAFIFSFLVVF